jgi:hypothetical protein
VRHQHLLIRRLGTLLRSRMTGQGHLAQVVQNEGRGNCLPPRDGCWRGCIEAQDLMRLTEPFMATTKARPAPKPLRLVVLKRPARREHRALERRAAQVGLFDSEVAG